MAELKQRSTTSIGLWPKDYFAGILMLLLGLGAVYQSKSYELGSLNNVGPGFFPSIVAWLLVVVGIAITLTARSNGSSEGDTLSIPDLRGSIAILAGLIAFVVLGEYAGLLPATFALVFISALGDRENSIVSALILAACMCVVAVVVFSWALKMHFPLFGGN